MSTEADRRRDGTDERPPTQMLGWGAVHQAITALGCGAPVIICDDPVRPTCGEFVCTADRIDTATMAFLVQHSSGFIEVAIPDVRGDELNLPAMPGASRYASQQCVTVDAADGVGTGISARDRARTARVLADPTAQAHDLTRPGHVVPVRVAAAPLRPVLDVAEVALRLVVAANTSAAVMAVVTGHWDQCREVSNGTALLDFAARHHIVVLEYGQVPATMPTMSA